MKDGGSGGWRDGWRDEWIDGGRDGRTEESEKEDVRATNDGMRTEDLRKKEKGGFRRGEKRR